MKTRKEIEQQITRKAFWERLEVLAASCKKDLTQMEVSMYDGLFAQKVGYDRAAETLGQVIVARRGVDPMPTVGDLLRLAGAEGAQTIESKAEIAANAIIAAIGQHGWNWSQKVPDFQKALEGQLGVLGAEVVRRIGGWQAVCEAEGPNSVLRAQYRNLARAILESGFAVKQAVAQTELAAAAPVPELGMTNS